MILKRVIPQKSVGFLFSGFPSLTTGSRAIARTEKERKETSCAPIHSTRARSRTITYISLPWLNVAHPVELITIGLGWLALTLLFEFSFGLWQGKSWQVMFEAYTFNNGNIWLIVLMVTTLAPYLATKLRELM